MSHECPDCYESCFCGGDIDDMLMNDTAEETGCVHCPFFDDADADDDDCRDCGTCDSCIERTKGYADEMASAPSEGK